MLKETNVLISSDTVAFAAYNRTNSRKSEVPPNAGFREHCEHVFAITLLTMLDGFEILTTSGVVLWSKSYVPVRSSVINNFVKDVFIEEKVLSGANIADDTSATQNPSYKRDQYTLKWASVKDLGLIFVVCIAQG